MFRLATLTALLGAVATLAAPTSFQKRAAACSSASQTYVDNLTCPSLQLLGGFLQYQSDSVGTNTITILDAVNELLLSDSPSSEVTTIVKSVDTGIVVGVADGVVDTLKDLAVTIPELDPDCACNMVLCNNDLDDAKGQCELGSSNEQEGCGQAIYVCSAFYTRAQINTYTGCCSSYSAPS